MFPKKNLQYGQTSDDVKQLQQFLISQNYPISAGATGFFGDQTKAALSQWQQANGISPSTPGFGTNWGPLSIAAAQKINFSPVPFSPNPSSPISPAPIYSAASPRPQTDTTTGPTLPQLPQVTIDDVKKHYVSGGVVPSQDFLQKVTDALNKGLSYNNAEITARGGTLPSKQPQDSSITSGTINPGTSYDFKSTKPNQPGSLSSLPDYSQLFQPTPSEQAVSKSEQDLIDFQNKLLGKAQFQTTEESAYGVPGYQQTIDDLTARMAELKNNESIIKTSYEGAASPDKGVLQPFVTGEEEYRLRQNTVEGLGLAAQLDAAQLRLSSAQAKADKAVQQTYAPIEEAIKVKQANIQTLLNDPNLSLDDKKRAFFQQLALKQQEAQIALNKQDASEAYKTLTTAAANIKNFVPTDEFPTAALALAAMQEAAQVPDKQEALRIAAETGLLQDKSTSITEANGRRLLINSLTGEVIKDLGSVSTKSETRDTNVTNYLESKKGSDGLISAETYQEGLKRYIAEGGTRANFLASFPPQSYLRQQEIDKLPQGLKSAISPTPSLESVKQMIFKQMTTPEWSTATDEQKISYIHSLGGNPKDFGL